MTMKKQKKLDIQDSISKKSRQFESIQSALKVGNGVVVVSIDNKDTLYSQRNACPHCGISLGDLEPRTFSFNSPFGACRKCNGLGIKIEFDPELIIPDRSKSILEGAVKPWLGHFATFRSAMLRDVGKRFGFDLYTPISNMTDQQLRIILYGIHEKSIMDICDLSIDDCYKFFKTIELSETERYIAKTILKEIISRLEFLRNVGLNYLSLNRMTATLSGGESQRIRLATQIGSNLTGVLYVLDEPTIGLHQRDNARLISTLKRLRDLDNTLIVVEHDEEIMRNSDWIIDIGQGAGIHGGAIVASGPLEEIINNPGSITGAFLRGDQLVVHRHERRKPSKWLRVHNASENNLKSVDVRFPLGCMTAVTGVSGSGKSTLINDILFRALAAHFYDAKERP